MEGREVKMKDSILHSSLSPVLRLQRDVDDLPYQQTSVGVEIQRGSRGYVLIFHEPKLSSTVHGIGLDFDQTSTDDLDKRTREALLQMSKACRILAQDFLAHAERLKAEAKREHLVEDSPIPTPDKNHARMVPMQPLDYTDPKLPSPPTPDPFD